MANRSRVYKSSRASVKIADNLSTRILEKFDTILDTGTTSVDAQFNP